VFPEDAARPLWSPPDRLSLAAAMTGEEAVRDFRLFSYTPDTSLPGWKGQVLRGYVEVRAKVDNVERSLACFPKTLRDRFGGRDMGVAAGPPIARRRDDGRGGRQGLPSLLLHPRCS
jgi:hypothetical protein